MNLPSWLNPFQQAETLPTNLSNEDYKKLKSDPAGFMVSLIQNQFTQYKKEIAHWQTARQSALNTYMPRRYLLQLLYNDIVDDLFIWGQMENRFNRMLNKPFRIVNYKTGTEDPIKTELLKKAWFFDFQTLAAESGFYGPTLIYTNELSGNQVTKVDKVWRTHVVPETRQILQQISDTTGMSYLEEPISQYCTMVGKESNLGLLNKIAPLWIFKKHSWQSWDQFEEMFGVPIRWAKTASTDPKVKATITKWLKDMGQASYALFPEGTTFEVKESTRSDAFQVFEMKRKACNEEIALGINGQFETSSASGSRAKAETVVESTQDQITSSDLRFMTFVINDQLLPLLMGLGYPFNPETDRFEFNLGKELGPMDKLTVYKGVSDMGFDIDPEDVANTFNVKVIGKKQPVIIPPGNDPEKDKPTNQLPKPKTKEEGSVDNILKLHHSIAELHSNVH